jgi:hypothetical protein
VRMLRRLASSAAESSQMRILGMIVVLDIGIGLCVLRRAVLELQSMVCAGLLLKNRG